MHTLLDTISDWYRYLFMLFQARFPAAEQQQFELPVLFVVSLVLTGLLVVIIGLLVLQRLYNNRIGFRMGHLARRIDDICTQPADTDGFITAACTVLVPGDYPYFERYVRRHLARSGTVEEPHLLIIARESGFNDHIAKRALRSRGWRRALALRSLSYLRNPGNVPLFRKALTTSSSHHVRYAASLGLALCGDTESVELIIRRIYHPDRPNRDQVLAVFEAYGPGVCAALSGLLAKDMYCGTIRTVFLDFLRVQKFGRAEPDITALLEKEISVEVVIHAVETLGVVGSAGSAETVKRFLSHENFVVRLKALVAYARLDGDRALEVLERALDDDDWWVRRNAAEALVHTGGGERLLERAAAEGETARGRTAAMVLDETRAGKHRMRFRFG